MVLSIQLLLLASTPAYLIGRPNLDGIEIGDDRGQQDQQHGNAHPWEGEAQDQSDDPFHGVTTRSLRAAWTGSPIEPQQQSAQVSLFGGTGRSVSTCENS